MHVVCVVSLSKKFTADPNVRQLDLMFPEMCECSTIPGSSLPYYDIALGFSTSPLGINNLGEVSPCLTIRVGLIRNVSFYIFVKHGTILLCAITDPRTVHLINWL